jgi:hypothetical protein
MDDLVTFLRACLDEDERVALEAAAQTGGNVEIVAKNLDIIFECLGRHWARHDPARVLAEVAAKRAIVDLHSPSEGDCRTCAHLTDDEDPDGNWYTDVLGEPWPCPTLRHLAAVYADQPGYRPEWAPLADQAAD